MKLNLAVITLLAVTTAGVQAQQRSSLAANRAGHFNAIQAAASRAASRTPSETTSGMRQRVDDMQSTLVKMHAVLDQMRLKATVNSKDPLAKSNLEMWDLMVAQLDEELKDLKISMVEREQWEARRISMYKQADVKAQAEAQAAQQAEHPQAEAPNSSPSPK